MTFLLQKFNAINRTRVSEARARNGLRPSASGIAFTGRLAACLLLAGFLGVGSAIAQPHVLRVGGGSISVSAADADGDFGFVHHYVIGEDATNDPTVGGTVSTFLVGGIALVNHNRSTNMLTVTPVGPGNFKIALTDMVGDLDDKLDEIAGRPVNFEVQSAHAPMLTGIDGDADEYNAGAGMDMEDVTLVPRDDTSEEFEDIHTWFDDPNDIFLTYTAKADKVKYCGGLDEQDPPQSKCEADDQIEVDVATATVDDKTNTLTVALTSIARVNRTLGGVEDSSSTAVWVFAHDAAGEYARKQINVTVGPPTNPYVENPSRI